MLFQVFRIRCKSFGEPSTSRLSLGSCLSLLASFASIDLRALRRKRREHQAMADNAAVAQGECGTKPSPTSLLRVRDPNMSSSDGQTVTADRRTYAEVVQTGEARPSIL